MLGAIAIIPSAPVLVPDLAGAAAAELTDLRAAVLAAVAELGPQWIAVGAAPVAAEFGPDAAGTFAGFGVDVKVRLSPQATEPAELPLCALMAGWVRDQVTPAARVRVHTCADPAGGAALGARLRAEIDRAAEPIGVLIVADGANTLSPAAPGGYHPHDAAVQHALDEALAGGVADGLTGLGERIVGRAGWAALAGLAGTTPWTARELYRGAPYGVGYFAGVWRRCPA